MSLESVVDYFSKEYLDLEQLACDAGVTPERVLELVETQCIPAHSYEVNQATTVKCNIKEAYSADITNKKYYNPSIVMWIKNATALAEQNKSLTDVAKQVREQFNAEFEAAFGDAVTPGCKGLNNAWRYLMNGTWGICLKEISIPFMAKKELSRLKVSQLCQMDDPTHQLTAEEKQQLEEAIANYESATKQFAPHLVAMSSRAREIEAAANKYLHDGL